MSHSEQLQELLQRVAALEARESAERRVQRLSGDYHHHVGQYGKTERDRIIAMIDQAHEIAYARAIQRSNEPQKQKIKQADDVAQRMFMFAQGKAAQPR